MGVFKKTVIAYRCERCKHEWIPRESEKPIVCPKCKSPYWDKPRGGELKFKWTCPKCSEELKFNSENSLIVGKTQHLKKHEIKGY